MAVVACVIIPRQRSWEGDIEMALSVRPSVFRPSVRPSAPISQNRFAPILLKLGMHTPGMRHDKFREKPS